jgi:hypothetical protein
VDFNVATTPNPLNIAEPILFFQRLKMESIGKRIPLSDVQWIAGLLGQLTPEQIRDAFRGAGFDPDEVEGFAGAVLKRIAELKTLPGSEISLNTRVGR